MELTLAVHGNLREYLAREKTAGAKAVTAAVRRAASNLKNDARRQVVAAGLDRNARPGKSVSKTFQDASYPARGASLGAAARVYSKFPRAISAFQEGVTITARGGRWLVIPTDRVGTLGNHRVKPAQHGPGSLQFVPTRDPNVARLVWKHGADRGAVAYWLVRQARITKRLHFFESGQKWGDRIADYAVAEWDRQAERLGLD